jgi:pyruvate-ferredoxin/flavodoxin oxidoreductase
VKYPGIPLTTNGNQLVAYFTEARLADAGIFYPITPSTEQGENFELSFARGELNVFGEAKIAVEAEGEHAAQGGAIAFSVTGKRTVNFTSGQGIVYGIEQYYHAPGKLSTMVLEVAARALTKASLNVHCGHDDIYTALDTGWIMLMAKDAQQAADQALILRRVTELSLTPGMNIQDGFLTSHLERTFLKHEADLIREFIGRSDDIIECPTEAQKELFGPTRRRVPEVYNLMEPIMIGTVQNQEHYMNGVVARRDCFIEPIHDFLAEAYQEFGRLTGRYYGFVSEYNTEDADTVFVALGSAAENIEAGVDYIQQRDGAKVGVVHINVLRPFPEAEVVEALRGKKNVIVLERMDDQTAGDQPLARDIRTALMKGLENARGSQKAGYPVVAAEDMPEIYSGVYGLGSRDFRPEHIIGAYEYAVGKNSRQDGASAAAGERFFYLGVDHPYAVVSDDTPSLLPEDAIAVRFHSIGGWGMITTGKNLSEILGDLGAYASNRDFPGEDKQLLHVSANPKYGSEKKGAPTNYFLTAASERIRVNCDLRHVDVVLCCDPKAFTHTNPLLGLREGGAIIWESNEDDPAKAWERIPKEERREIIDKNIRVYTLNGFAIAKAATPRPDLQLRMQGNSFLGAFFKVSPFLEHYKIPRDEFLSVVEAQYHKKFGKLGDAVVESNMTVMSEGYSQVRKIPHGDLDAPDTSSMRGQMIEPVSTEGSAAGPCNTCNFELPPLYQREFFDKEFRAGLGYNQPASALAAAGAMAAATGADNSKFVARRLVPKYNPENCTQCMSCITACPDTALPNTAQDLSTILTTFVRHYVSDEASRDGLLKLVGKVEDAIRVDMVTEAKKKKDAEPFAQLANRHFREAAANANGELAGVDVSEALDELEHVLAKVPIAYGAVVQMFMSKEKKEPGTGGVFSIFVNDLCKGCGQCVVECGDHMALEMVEEDEEINADLFTGVAFMDLLPDTPSKYLGIYNPEDPQESKAAALHNHLMQRTKYEALVSGDGACAGCGEKTILRAIATLTEAYMRPIFASKATRLREKAASLKANGLAQLDALQAGDEARYEVFRRSVLHLVMGMGGESLADTQKLIEQNFKGGNAEIIDALVAVLEQDAFNHDSLITVEGKAIGGMNVMGMTANTGCSTVFGSTPPSNPHPYPWMNSLFQDGTTIGWLIAESFIQNHARRSVLPERLSDIALSGFDVQTCELTEGDYFSYTHFSDALMTEREITELPKIWAVGGDGGIGDIGYQNLSKTVLQNRPNVNIVMLDTQVYSNTGGQNSDSSVMPGGFDMNQFGVASPGKLTEKKEVAQSMTSGHGSPFVAQVSMANTPNLYKSILTGLAYRGCAFFQCYTTCQPEHGVGDSESTRQAQLARDSRGMLEFVYDPTLGEDTRQMLSLKGNPNPTGDWYLKMVKATKEKYNFTVAHWAATEARFRRHLMKAPEDVEQTGIHLDDILWRITQDDVVKRRVFDPKHRSFVPEFGVYIMLEQPDGSMKPMLVSRQMVLFAVERRKNWRMMQSRAGVDNPDLKAQTELLKRYGAGEIDHEALMGATGELVEGIKAEQAG